MVDARKEMKRGLWWFGAAAAVARVIDVVALLVVLYFLTREEMGLAALPLAFIIVMEGFNGLGVGTALIRAEKASKEVLSSLFWFCAGLGLVAAAVVAALSPVLADFYEHPELAPMFAFSSLKLVFVSLSLVPMQRLSRELQFRQVSLAQTGAGILEAVTKIVLAATGFGAWALVAANVGRGLFLFVFCQGFGRFWPQLHFAWRDVRWFLSFGWRASMSTVVTEGYKNLDYFLVGRFLGMEALGLYRVAFEVAMMPIEAIAQPIYRVTYPVFARVATGAGDLSQAFIDASGYMFRLAAPTAAFLFFCSPALLDVVTDPRWADAAPAIGLLCWAALLRAETRLFDNFFYALGRPGLAVWDALLTFLVLALTMPPLILLLRDELGVLSVCIAWLGAYPIIFAVLFLLGRRVSDLRFFAYLRGLAPTAAAVVVSGLVMWAVLEGARELGLGAWLQLLGAGGGGLLAYLAFLRYGLGVRIRDLKP